MKDIVKLKDIKKSFTKNKDQLKVLDGITFNGNNQEIIGIVGPSGSGKSTILNIISKLIPFDSGSLEINGKVGYMFQKDHLLNWQTIYKNLLLGLKIQKKINEENINYCLELAKKYGLNDFLMSYPLELSGGMRQRVSLIRTLAIKPDILLLDEPFSALDYQTRLNLCDDVYKIIKDAKVCGILVTHDISEAISICDKVIVLSKRPAVIKSIYDLKDKFIDCPTPLKRRTHPLFSHYFNMIWQDLGDNIEEK